MVDADSSSNEPPVEIPSKVSAHVEKLVTEGLKREMDQEENVVRSLPFFATSIAALLALMGFVKPSLSLHPINVLTIAEYVLCVLLAILLLILAVLIYHATKKRNQYHPMQESELIDYATELVKYHKDGAGSSGSVNEDGVIRDIQKSYTAQLAIYAEALRGINLARVNMRAKMFTTLVIAVVVALILVGVTIIQDRQIGGSHARSGSSSLPNAHIGEAKDANAGRHGEAREPGNGLAAPGQADQTVPLHPVEPGAGKSDEAESPPDARHRDRPMGGEGSRNNNSQGSPKEDGQQQVIGHPAQTDGASKSPESHGSLPPSR
ncbi:hypothetical protein SAMN02982917_5960 [Azospirillum oryzae]|uniref:Uncharacterized protein n=1 Tax=Azospirillum oryzae TaxID=286727 RepID=A0A1X7HIP5_9PROT|nr:hypothetical protein [Azospirillum oryzae]SMF86455.1 hypothetical protein SAMN02982917_5960 [Azospirillum oryzae]